MDKDGNEGVVTTSYKIKFFNSARFMATSLLSLVDNFTEETDKLNVKIAFLNMKVPKKEIG